MSDEMRKTLRKFSDKVNDYEGELVVRGHKAYDKKGECVLEAGI